MHDPKIIEVMARAIGKRHADKAGGCFAPDDIPEQPDDCAEGLCYCAKSAQRDATRALTALCTLHPGVGAILRGEAVAVSPGMLDEVQTYTRLLAERVSGLAASPYAQETPDAE